MKDDLSYYIKLFYYIIKSRIFNTNLSYSNNINNINNYIENYYNEFFIYNNLIINKFEIYNWIKLYKKSNFILEINLYYNYSRYKECYNSIFSNLNTIKCENIFIGCDTGDIYIITSKFFYKTKYDHIKLKDIINNHFNRIQLLTPLKESLVSMCKLDSYYIDNKIMLDTILSLKNEFNNYNTDKVKEYITKLKKKKVIIEYLYNINKSDKISFTIDINIEYSRNYILIPIKEFFMYMEKINYEFKNFDLIYKNINNQYKNNIFFKQFRK